MHTVSDYADVFIPWGPKWYSNQIMGLLDRKARAQFFSQHYRDGGRSPAKHRHVCCLLFCRFLALMLPLICVFPPCADVIHLFCFICFLFTYFCFCFFFFVCCLRSPHSVSPPSVNQNQTILVQIFATSIEGVIDGPIGHEVWCIFCMRKEPLVVGEGADASKFVPGRLSWLKESPAMQDFEDGRARQLMTGSFHPVIEADWTKGVYLPAGSSVPTVSPLSGPSVADEATSTSGGDRKSSFKGARKKKVASKKKMPSKKTTAGGWGGGGGGGGLGFGGSNNGGGGVGGNAFASPISNNNNKGGAGFSFAAQPSTNHSPWIPKADGAAGANDFRCQSCGQEFFSRNQLFRHMKDVGCTNAPAPASSSQTQYTNLGSFGQPAPVGAASSSWGAPAVAAPSTGNAPGGWGSNNVVNPTTNPGYSAFGAAPSAVAVPTNTDFGPAAAEAANFLSEAVNPMSKLLLLTTTLSRNNLVTREEKGVLKDLVLQQDHHLLAALDCYEFDTDLQEFCDTCRRVCRLSL